MLHIKISDITLKEATYSGSIELSFREKLELAKQLDRLNIDIIELAPVQNVKTDILLIKSYATAVHNSTLAVPVDINNETSIPLLAGALKNAPHARLQVSVPVSTVQMEYLCHRKPSDVLRLIETLITRCKEFSDDVEFLAEDASRSEPDFFKQAILAAVNAGATTVTVCDDAGTMLPNEFYTAIHPLSELLPASVALGVRCSDSLHMATADAMAALQAGALEIKAEACGSRTCPLDHIVTAIARKGDTIGVSTGVRTTELNRSLNQIRWMCKTVRSKGSPFDNGVQPATVSDNAYLNAQDSSESIAQVAARLGYDLSEEDIGKVYEAFQRIAAKKERVTYKEFDAIIASAAMQVPPTYRMESYVINSGNILTASAHMKLQKNEETMESVCLGDGPIDAAFLAIEQILGRHFELDDFQIQAVTEGREAMGETVVRLRANGKVYSGRGISTDIIGSSIRAYLSAVNKIVYEEADA